MPSDQQLIRGLQTGDNAACQLFYRQYYPAVERFITQNNGDYDQAQDLFQETILIVLANVKQADFTLTASLKAYVFSISKKLWLKHLKRNSHWVTLDQLDESALMVAPYTDSPPSLYEVMGTILARLTAQCQALLVALFLGNKDTTTLMQEKGYATRHSAQNQKYKCLQQARRIVKTRLPWASIDGLNAAEPFISRSF